MDDAIWMNYALALAKRAREKGEVPIGAIVVLDNKIIGRGYNSPISKLDPTAHAEIMALRSAAKKLKNYRLVGATLYVTLEPCSMCASAMIHARIKRCVYGAVDPKKALNITNHTVNYTGSILAEECGEVLKLFFREKR
ncbi:MAG TPA: tRNA adenosine(34) deaminase TadA [Gammaproteobacteria bacterium]|nr:tRNA adenosine(34) deaminase TadA [Gammaproteobacteria bacterium]